MNNDNNNDNLSAGKNLAAQVKSLKSLIHHARVIEDEVEVVARSLQEKYVFPEAYQLETSLKKNLKTMKDILSDSYDFHFREFLIVAVNRQAAVVFIEGMSNQELINMQIIDKLMLPPIPGREFSPQDEMFSYIKDTMLSVASISKVDVLSEAVKRLLAGDTLLFVDSIAWLIVVESRKMEARAISEPATEINIRGARDGFVESLQTNITLLRRRIKNPNLITKKVTLGVRSETDIAIVYFRGIVDGKLVHAVEQRLEKIKIDLPNGVGVIQGMMEDHPYSPFPTMLATERPDKVVAGLMEGKVAVMMDGAPFSLLAPATLSDFFQTSDDYNEKWVVSSLIRFARYISALLALATPAVFVAITTFTPGMLPMPLAINIANARLGIPFPAFLEALVMIILLEILQEAGIRLPKTIGPAVSIVGGLVVGEATVRAGLVSAPMVIVIAFTAIASFNIANYRLNLIVRLLRVPLMLMGATLGMFGVMLGYLLLVAHFSMIESFGVPYLEPMIQKSARQLSDVKDTFVVAPPSAMDERPAYLKPEDSQRQKE
ncbi:MAG: GerA spore germination protein [Firmicutes bacterium]|nr:GerA spore germination protein [Bacillota bacterium]